MFKRKPSTGSWKEEMLERWKRLCSLYWDAQKSPSFKLWSLIIIELIKMIIRILLKKIMDYFFD